MDPNTTDGTADHSQPRRSRGPSAEPARSQNPGVPQFSRRLGAPIATVTPVGQPPSQVTGSSAGPPAPEPPESQQQTQRGDLGVLPNPDGRPVTTEQDTEAVDPNSFYAQVGGRATFQGIVDVFYDQVAQDPQFRAHYPEQDLSGARQRLLMFLEQYWGGPKTYQQRRGHPRLRMRHMPFRVDAEARDTWLKYMRVAVESAELSPMHEEVLWDYLDRAAHAMVNS